MLIIPIGTEVRLRRAPLGNYLLLGLNIAVFLLGDLGRVEWAGKEQFMFNASLPTLGQYVSYQFLHGDVYHLLGNMLFLWIFGNAVCDRMGSVAYVLFYLAGGVFAAFAYAHYNNSPLLGASGAIAAVTTAFLVLFPRVHVAMLLWVFFYMTTFQLPSMILIVFKIILWDNVVAPMLDQHAGMAASVAYSAHLAGYAFGFCVSLLLLLTRALPRSQFDQLALMQRWMRRGGVGDFAPAGPVRTRAIRLEEVESRPLEAPRLTAAEQLREDILDRLAERDVGEAARLTLRLFELDPPNVLPRAAQLELANYFAQREQHELAVRMYEAYLAAYPGAADAAQVRLMAGLIWRRYLGDAPRAAAHLREALDGLNSETQRALAMEELRLAGG
ncbi:MAG: rhomboid family intramembrane serine protease [Phycisphaerae bacterium]